MKKYMITYKNLKDKNVYICPLYYLAENKKIARLHFGIEHSFDHIKFIKADIVDRRIN